MDGPGQRASRGRPTGVGARTRDETAELEAEKARRGTRAAPQDTADTLHHLMAASAQGILVTTPQGSIESANAALESMFGYAPGELVGKSLDSLVPEAVRASHAQQHRAFWKVPQPRPMASGLDLSGRRKNGTSFPIEVSLAHIVTKAGRRALAFVTDITQRKQAEEALRQSHAALQAKANQLRRRTEQLRRLASDLTIAEQLAREQLARRLHDDLQQLLFSARLRLDRVLADRAAGASGRASSLSKARDELEQAIAASRSLSLELFPPQLHDAGLSAAISWLATWMKEKYGLTVEVTADPQATLDGKDLRILAFESVRELLFDVVKHAKVTRATVDLAVAPDNHLRISVADQGVGFDPAAVFSPTARPAGWGLFSIRERAELLGGHLDVNSAPGRGTRFTLLMPRSGAGPA